MAKVEFRARLDGNGRVRYFVDGAEHLLDEYISKYVKIHGEMPEIPVGLGGRGPADPVPTAKVDVLEQQLAQQQAENALLRAQLKKARQGDEADVDALAELQEAEQTYDDQQASDEAEENGDEAELSGQD